VPVTYTLDAARRLVLSRASGLVTAEDFVEHGKRLGQDPGFDPGFCQLLDCSEVRELRLSTEALRGMARFRLFGPGSRRAVVAPRDLHYGLARMYEMLRGDAPEQLQVFRTREEAERWLEEG
jgi:hypothetical protein